MTRVGVVTIAHRRRAHLENQHRSLALGSRRPDRYVVVAMSDPGLGPAEIDGLESEVDWLSAPPGGLPLATARNRGAGQLIESGADVLVFLDVDCLAGRDLVAGYAEVVEEHPHTLWSGPVTYLPPAPRGGYDLVRLERLDDPHPARPAPARGEIVTGSRPELFWSLSFAVSAPTWQRLGGFCEDYVGYGGEDTDLAFGARAAGIDLGWVGAARAYHQHHPVTRPPVEHVDDIIRNGSLFADRWGEWPMQGWLREFEEAGLVRRDGHGWVSV